MGPICQNTNPFFNISKTPTYETEISTKSNPYKYKIHLIINNYPPWTTLTKHYVWIYATPTPQTINLNCPKKLQITIDIQNIGILQRKQNEITYIANFINYITVNFHHFNTGMIPTRKEQEYENPKYADAVRPQDFPQIGRAHV